MSNASCWRNSCVCQHNPDDFNKESDEKEIELDDNEEVNGESVEKESDSEEDFTDDDADKEITTDEI